MLRPLSPVKLALPRPRFTKNALPSHFRAILLHALSRTNAPTVRGPMYAQHASRVAKRIKSRLEPRSATPSSRPVGAYHSNWVVLLSTCAQYPV